MKKELRFSQQIFRAYSWLIFILLLVLFIIVFLIMYSNQIDSEISAQQEFVLKTEQQIDTSLQNMDRIVNGLLYNKAFMQIIKSEKLEDSYTKYSNEILDTIVSLDAPQFLSHRIIVFNRDTYFTFTKTGEEQTHILNAIKSYESYDGIMESAGKKVILPVHTDPFGIAEVPVYSVVRAINDGMNVYGIIEVQNNYEYLESFCVLDYQQGEVVLFSGSGDVIHPFQQTDDSVFLENLYDVIAERPLSSGSFQWENHQISYITSEYSNWITVIYCPLANIMPGAKLVFVFLSGFTIALLCTLGIIRVLTNRLTAPLSELNQQINQVSYDNLSVQLSHSYKIAEMENINRSFKTMLHQLEIEIAQNAQAKANEERANYIALQSLMNPHTIYNTITMIESVCYVNGDYEAADLCISFSQMLRYISDNTKSTYTIEDELQHLDHYAILMKKRYEGRLLIEVDAEPSLMSFVVPKFTLQPLVENAIKHGMNRSCQPFIVRVMIGYTDSGWWIAVSDNGHGFTEEKRDEVYSQFAYCDKCLLDNTLNILKMKIDNMALNNIYIRFRIMKGSGFQFMIDNLEPSGCQVALCIFEQEGEEEVC